LCCLRVIADLFEWSDLRAASGLLTVAALIGSRVQFSLWARSAP
jgi:hypothetical protein